MLDSRSSKSRNPSCRRSRGLLCRVAADVRHAGKRSAGCPPLVSNPRLRRGRGCCCSPIQKLRCQFSAATCSPICTRSESPFCFCDLAASRSGSRRIALFTASNSSFSRFTFCCAAVVDAEAHIADEDDELLLVAIEDCRGGPDLRSSFALLSQSWGRFLPSEFAFSPPTHLLVDVVGRRRKSSGARGGTTGGTATGTCAGELLSCFFLCSSSSGPAFISHIFGGVDDKVVIVAEEEEESDAVRFSAAEPSTRTRGFATNCDRRLPSASGPGAGAALALNFTAAPPPEKEGPPGPSFPALKLAPTEADGLSTCLKSFPPPAEDPTVVEDSCAFPFLLFAAVATALPLWRSPRGSMFFTF
mmetsp:Transcript_5765/g.14379  ORF Transcript_5765/g.14379 Transcript_5765/m.14379 type:complete len:359 (+) Transcript_5765:1110-2186(+)